jgi:hypothetical protein
LTLYKSNFPDGFISSNTPSVISIVAINVETFTLSALDISNGYVTLSVAPDRPETVQVDWNGIAQYETVDYTVTGTQIDFEPSLLGLMVAGDIVKVSYQ